jgi:hypothetical protein
VPGLERRQGLVEYDQVDSAAVDGGLDRGEVDPFAASASLGPGLAPRGLDQDAPHRLGRGGEEVPAAAPSWVLRPHEPEKGLVDQGGGLERLAGLLLSQFLRRQPAQLVVDQRQKLRSRVRLTLLDGRQDVGHVRHRRRSHEPAARVSLPVCVTLGCRERADEHASRLSPD